MNIRVHLTGWSSRFRGTSGLAMSWTWSCMLTLPDLSSLNCSCRKVWPITAIFWTCWASLTMRDTVDAYFVVFYLRGIWKRYIEQVTWHASPRDLGEGLKYGLGRFGIHRLAIAERSDIRSNYATDSTRLNARRNAHCNTCRNSCRRFWAFELNRMNWSRGLGTQNMLNFPTCNWSVLITPFIGLPTYYIKQVSLQINS